MLFNQAVARYDSQISDIKAQIEALREKLSQVEHDRQNLLATEQMWESAIAQITAAKAATEAIGQTELIKDAKTAIDAVFSELPQLPAAKDNTDSVEQTEPTTPTSPTSDTSDTTEATTIEVETIDTTTNTTEKATEPTIEPTTEPTTDTNEKPAYHSLNWREFLRYAKSKNINTKGKTRAEIELELLNQSKQ